MKKLRNLIAIFVLLFALAAVLILSAAAGGTDTPLRYGGTTVTDPEVAYVYSLLASEITKDVPPETISIADDKRISVDELKQAYYLFVSDYPECFWARGDFGYSYRPEDGTVTAVKPTYTFSGDALTEARAELEIAIAELMGGLPNGTNYEKALYLHDRLAAWVDYEMVGEHQTAYGALVSKKAVCAGYAAAYQLLLNRAGISAWAVTGVSQKPGEAPVAHAWNLVWLEDGVCVYTDVTWDDDDSDIYRYYFNLSKEEISRDHAVDTEIFTLPACGHEGKSYFDTNSCTVTDNISMQALAALFGPAEGNTRSAVLCYEGNDINVFLDHLSSNQNALYNALECGAGSRGYRLSHMAGEIHLTVTGNFPPMTYLVSISAPNELKTYDNAAQYVVIDADMNSVTYRTAAGYYFPLDYSVDSVNGVQVTRIDFHTLRISGTPTSHTTLTLPAPMLMQKEETPQAVFTPGALGSGSLSGLSAGMKYSTDGVHWIDIDSDETLPLTGLTASKLYIIKCGNGDTTLDSDRQTLTIPNPLPPEEDESDGQNESTDTPLPGDKDPDDKKDNGGSFFGDDLGYQIITVLLVVVAVSIIGIGVAVIKKRN